MLAMRFRGRGDHRHQSWRSTLGARPPTASSGTCSIRKPSGPREKGERVEKACADQQRYDSDAGRARGENDTPSKTILEILATKPLLGIIPESQDVLARLQCRLAWSR